MAITAGELCAFLNDLDAPDRLHRPLLLDPEAMRVRVTRLAEALEEALGRHCDVELLPWGGEHAGTITIPGGVTSGETPISLVIGWYGPFVSFADYSEYAELVVGDTDYSRIQEAIFANGFGLSLGVSGLAPARTDRPYPRLFSARTADDLVRQVRGLPAEAREWLCATLDVPVDGPEERPPSLDVLTAEEVLAEVERVKACVAVLATPPDSDERRWAAIDDAIVDGVTIKAIKAIRDEFGGGLKEAMETYHDRAIALRLTRPHASAAGGRDRPRKPGGDRPVSAVNVVPLGRSTP